MKTSRNPATRRKPGAQPGNHNAYKHGRYARTPDLATQLFSSALGPHGRCRPVIIPRLVLRGTSSLPRGAVKQILVEGVLVKVPTSAELVRLQTLPTEEFLVEVKRLWVIMALDALKFPDLPLKDVLFFVRKIIKWSRV